MAVRFSGRTCKNCPQRPETNAAPKEQIITLTSKSESERLWKHVLFGTGTCISMIEGYAKAKLTGNPLKGLLQLRDRLNRVIALYEEKQ